jgi:hypothetical protein
MRAATRATWCHRKGERQLTDALPSGAPPLPLCQDEAAIRWLARTNYHTRARLEKIKAAFRAKHQWKKTDRCVAVQIRRGDKVHWDNSGCVKEDYYMNEPRCRQDFSASFAEYMAVVKQELDGPAMKGGGANTVYVMSDDPDFVAKGAAEFPDYKIMILSG